MFAVYNIEEGLSVNTLVYRGDMVIGNCHCGYDIVANDFDILSQAYVCDGCGCAVADLHRDIDHEYGEGGRGMHLSGNIIDGIIY